jgi:hypothetical protein
MAIQAAFVCSQFRQYIADSVQQLINAVACGQHWREFIGSSALQPGSSALFLAVRYGEVKVLEVYVNLVAGQRRCLFARSYTDDNYLDIGLACLQKALHPLKEHSFSQCVESARSWLCMMLGESLYWLASRSANHHSV